MTYVTPLYCTDEDIAVRAVGDFANLCPHWQRLAAGADGSFAVDGPWTLSSASVDFAAAGVTAGCVVRLTKPADRYGPSGDLYAVASVDAETGAVTLRPIGMATGKAPAPIGGLSSVGFEVPTFTPQIEEVSYSINREYNLDATVPGRYPTDLYEIRELRTLAVVMVLYQQYTMELRTDEGDYKIKVERLAAELDAIRSRLTLRWGTTGDPAPSVGFATRRVIR